MGRTHRVGEVRRRTRAGRGPDPGAGESARPAARGVAVPLLLVLLLLLSSEAAARPTPTPSARHSGPTPTFAPTAARSAPASTPVAVNVSLTVNATSVNLSSQFWGTTLNNEVHMFRGEPDAVNATPAKVLVWPGAMAGEDYDPFTETHFNTYDGTPTHALTTEAQFVELCRAIHCSAIMQVPAEIDNPSYAERIVNYTEVNLSFHPAYWMIGNEPELWNHWKVPWKQWGSTSTTGPTPTQFGNEVIAYVKAIRQVDNTTPILGLPASGCTCGYWTFSQWISGVLNVTGPIIQAVAFHEYPAGWLGTGNGSLQAFYGTIQSPANIPIRMAAARAAVQTACPGCNVSVLISEIGAALSWSAYGQYAIGFSGPLSLASQMTQAMDANLTNVDLFATELATTNSWFDPHGGARADYALYTQIFDHLGTEAFPVNVPGLGRTLYAIDTIDPNDHGRRDLMVVNDNINNAITFTPQFAEYSDRAPVEAWGWNGTIHTTHANGTQWVEPSTPDPVGQAFPEGLPANYTLPPQSLVLFETYPGGATFVRVNESGVPTAHAWYASLGPKFHETSSENLSLLLPAGAYPVASVGIPLPLTGKERNPIEQLGPFVASPALVGGATTNVSLRFVPQWRVNISASLPGAGTILPAVHWWNESQPLNLTAFPAPGYAFVRWTGWGPGGANGTNRTITLVPAGHVVEKAQFVVGQPDDLFETGLPPGTPWSVTVRGVATVTTAGTLRLYEPNGTFGFSVTPIPGYRAIPRNGSFTVAGGWSAVDVRFDAITPPLPLFPVTFHVTGLPPLTTVPLTVRDVTRTAGPSDPVLELTPGKYAYRLGLVPGYHPAVPEKTFVVVDGALTVVVPYVATVYRATWEGVGTRPGIAWSLAVDGRVVPAASAWASAWLANGTYSFSIVAPGNETVTPSTGLVVIAGFAMKQDVFFNLTEYPAGFVATGPGAGGPWSVRLGNLTQGAWAGRSMFQLVPGTYTFDVHAPLGFYAVPSHGNLTVSGATPAIPIQFHLSSERPSAALVAALSSGALSVSFWIGGSTFLGFATFRWLRRRGG